MLRTLAITERVVVSVPANTPVYVVVAKPAKFGATGRVRSKATPTAGRSPNVEELRQLLQLQRGAERRRKTHGGCTAKSELVGGESYSLRGTSFSAVQKSKCQEWYPVRKRPNFSENQKELCAIGEILGGGPVWYKMEGSVMYDTDDLEAFKQQCIRVPSVRKWSPIMPVKKRGKYYHYAFQSTRQAVSWFD